MTINKNIFHLINIEEITKYLRTNEKDYIIETFLGKELVFEEAFQFENEKLKVAIVILYNIILSNEELKNRKLTDSKANAFTMKNISSVTNVSDKALYKLNNIFYEKFPEYKKNSRNNSETDSDNEVEFSKIIEPIIKSIKSNRRKTEPQAINQKSLISIFITTLDYVKLLYPDKDAIRIKEYLSHVQLNLFLAGYDINELKLESIFGDFIKYLNCPLTDGRNESDFVKVKDVYGKVENKVYIELGR